MGGDLMVVQTRSENPAEQFELERGGWLIKRVDILKWGSEVVVHAVYDPLNPQNINFQMIFKHCRAITWDTLGNEYDERDLEADVVGFDVDAQGLEQRAVIHTDLFEIIIHYHEFVVQKNG